MKMQALKPLMQAVADNDKTAMLIETDILLKRDDCGPGWTKSFRKLAGFIYSGIPAFTINMPGGNSKLPFVSFSTLPGVDFCPGAGDCLKFCYSFRGHRYPAAFCRQVQNTILLNSDSGRELIKDDIQNILSKRKFQKAIKAGIKIDFRLHVDGDFRHLADLSFWMGFLKTDTGQKLAVYGYSKSFAIFLEYSKRGFAFPDNYLLNISSGSNADSETIKQVEQLPCTRGHFIGVKMPYKVTTDMHNDREHKKRLRSKYGSKKSFPCPGKCGDCTNAGHACGSKRFTGIPIIIAIH